MQQDGQLCSPCASGVSTSQKRGVRCSLRSHNIPFILHHEVAVAPCAVACLRASLSLASTGSTVPHSILTLGRPYYSVGTFFRQVQSPARSAADQR